MGYNIYDIHINTNTKNFNGLEWVVDGELGRRVYPGTWAKCHVKEVYANGDTLRKPGTKVTFTETCHPLFGDVDASKMSYDEYQTWLVMMNID